MDMQRACDMLLDRRGISNNPSVTNWRLLVKHRGVFGTRTLISSKRQKRGTQIRDGSMKKRRRQKNTL